MTPPDIATRSEADRLRDELCKAAPAYTLEPDGISLDVAAHARERFKANRLRHVETRLVRAASQMRRDSMHPYQRSFER